MQAFLVTYEAEETSQPGLLEEEEIDLSVIVQRLDQSVKELRQSRNLQSQINFELLQGLEETKRDLRKTKKDLEGSKRTNAALLRQNAALVQKHEALFREHKALTVVMTGLTDLLTHVRLRQQR